MLELYYNTFIQEISMKKRNVGIFLSIVGALSVALVATCMVSYNSPYKEQAQTLQPAKSIKPEPRVPSDTIYDFTLNREDGSQLPLANFEGKVVLIVNTAAKCNFAGQYRDLEQLYQKYKNDGLVIVGVSSNDFGQEIADHEERTCSIGDRVITTFTEADTVHVTGKNAHPLFAWLNHKAGMLGSVKWNFHKFLIGKDGNYIDWFAPTTKPTAKKIVKKIRKALAA